MSVEDLQAAEQQQGHTDNADPMGQSDHGGVPIYDLGAFRAVGHRGAQLGSLDMPSAYRRSYRLQAHLVQQAHAVVIGCNYSSTPRFERKAYIS